jgi:hypothetical protein
MKIINKKNNVLIFPSGSEVALEINSSLKNNKNINIFAGNSVDDHAKFTFKNYFGNFPFVNDKTFINFICSFVKKNNIDFIFPCTDYALDILKINENKIRCKVLTSCKETTSLCLSKEKTYSFFKKIIKTPKVFKSISCVKKFPVYIKPKIGYGSRNNFKINSKIQLKSLFTKDHLILEYLCGDEYTIDCFTNSLGELIFINARKRSRISNGISTNSILFKDKKIEEIAKKINSNIKLNGSWFFQLKKNKNNNYVLLEIAPRIAGSSAISRYLGVNLAELTILNETSNGLLISKNNFNIETDRSLKTKTKINIDYDYVYVDLDDTIIINNKINTDLIKVIYQFINDNKKIILITKHKNDLRKTLKKYKIQNLFNEIIHLNERDNKHKHMIYKNSIFIDDSFSERFKVKNNLNIPTFCVNSIECLIEF